MKSLFFNAEPTSDLQNHPTGYDREYDADDHAAFFAPLFSEAGVMAAVDEGACQISVKEGNTLQIAPGAAYIKGRMALFDGAETITITANCKIAARMNKSADVRSFQLVAVQDLVQTDDIYDLELASVAIVPVTGGFEAQVTDARTFLNGMARPPYLFDPVAVSVPLSWAGSGPWIQTVSVAGVTAADEHLGVFPPQVADAAARKLQYAAYGCLSPADCETVDGGVRLVCVEKQPAVAFQVVVKGVR